MKKCSVDGCDREYCAKGFCKYHWAMNKRNGKPSLVHTRAGVPMAFLLDSLTLDTEDCILWPFNKSGDGYARVQQGGKPVPAHRVVCRLKRGEPPDPTMDAAHSCGNGHKGCINWKHLSWKTRADNLRDCVAHGTHWRGERNKQARLTNAQVAEIRRLGKTVPFKVTAERFGTTAMYVSHIVYGHKRKFG